MQTLHLLYLLVALILESSLLCSPPGNLVWLEEARNGTWELESIFLLASLFRLFMLILDLPFRLGKLGCLNCSGKSGKNYTTLAVPTIKMIKMKIQLKLRWNQSWKSAMHT